MIKTRRTLLSLALCLLLLVSLPGLARADGAALELNDHGGYIARTEEDLHTFCDMSEEKCESWWIQYDGDLTLTKDLTLPSGRRIDVRGDLTIPSGMSLTVNGWVFVSGELVLQGKLNAQNGYFYFGRQYSTEQEAYEQIRMAQSVPAGVLVDVHSANFQGSFTVSSDLTIPANVVFECSDLVVPAGVTLTILGRVRAEDLHCQGKLVFGEDRSHGRASLDLYMYAQSETELRDMLNRSGLTDEHIGVAISYSGIISSDLTVPEGLLIDTHNTTIYAGVTVTINGRYDVAGSGALHGTIVNNGELVVHSPLTVSNGGTITGDGYFDVCPLDGDYELGLSHYLPGLNLSRYEIKGYSDGWVLSPKLEGTGWVQSRGNWYYLDADSNKLSGWLYDGAWYYLQPEMVCGTPCNIDDVWYFFHEDGRLADDVTGWYFYRWPNGLERWYYLLDGGQVYYGWLNDGGRWYYMGLPMRTDGIYYTTDEAWYAFDSNGQYLTNAWYQDADGYWYYAGADGKLVSGWQQIDGKWYYFNYSGFVDTEDGRTLSSPYMFVDGTYTIDGVEYSFDANGVWIENGGASGSWQLDGFGWWYQNADGSYPVSAWQQIDGLWYYFDSYGYLVTGWQPIDGAWYYFYADGSMAHDTVIDGYTLSSSGAMI